MRNQRLREGEEEERPFGKGTGGWFAIGLDELVEVVMIEVVCIDDDLLNVEREGVGMRLIVREIGVVENGVERVSMKLDTTGADGVSDDIGKIVRLPGWASILVC